MFPARSRPPKIEPQPFANRTQRVLEMQTEIAVKKYFCGERKSFEIISLQKQIFSIASSARSKRVPGHSQGTGTRAVIIAAF
jgi:hypothetical protein